MPPLSYLSPKLNVLEIAGGSAPPKTMPDKPPETLTFGGKPHPWPTR